MSKMLRKRKHFGRCGLPGHSECEVDKEIQGKSFNRAMDKREATKEIQEQLSGN